MPSIVRGTHVNEDFEMHAAAANNPEEIVIESITAAAIAPLPAVTMGPLTKFFVDKQKQMEQRQQRQRRRREHQQPYQDYTDGGNQTPPEQLAQLSKSRYFCEKTMSLIALFVTCATLLIVGLIKIEDVQTALFRGNNSIAEMLRTRFLEPMLLMQQQNQARLLYTQHPETLNDNINYYGKNQ